MSQLIFSLKSVVILFVCFVVFSSFNAQSHSHSGNGECSHCKKVKKIYLYLQDKNKNYLAGCVATLLIEPKNGFRAASLMKKPLGNYHSQQLNPRQLSPEQLQNDPVLLIHGDHSNSGLFIPMISRLLEVNPSRPIFTIDLQSSDGIVSEKHLPLLMDKVKKITALYENGKYPSISFVGHSSGGDVIGPLIKALAEERIFASGIVIKIGSIFEEGEAADIYHFPRGKVIEIVGTHDIFEGDNSYIQDQFKVSSGHLGLLFHPEVIERVCLELAQ